VQQLPSHTPVSFDMMLGASLDGGASAFGGDSDAGNAMSPSQGLPAYINSQNIVEKFHHGSVRRFMSWFVGALNSVLTLGGLFRAGTNLRRPSTIRCSHSPSPRHHRP